MTAANSALSFWHGCWLLVVSRNILMCSQLRADHVARIMRFVHDFHRQLCAPWIFEIDEAKFSQLSDGISWKLA